MCVCAIRSCAAATRITFLIVVLSTLMLSQRAQAQIPCEPEIIGEIGDERSVYRIEVVGSIAYISGSSAGLIIADVSDPTNPLVLGKWFEIGGAFDVVIEGAIAFVSNSDADCVHILDVSDLSNPTLVRSIPMPGPAYEMAYAHGFLCVATDTHGVQILDMRRLRRARIISSINTPGEARGLDYQDGLLYIADAEEGLRIADVRDPFRPVSIGTQAVADDTRSVDVEGDVAFLADGEAGFQVVDVSDPENPSVIGWAGTDEFVWSVRQFDDRLYVGDSRGLLQVYDVSLPQDPLLLGQLDCGYRTYDSCVVGDVAYVIANSTGARVVDVRSCRSDCLSLDVENLIAGGTALFIVGGGTPGRRSAIAWGVHGPPTRIREQNGWCLTFGFTLSFQRDSLRVVGGGFFDQDGELRIERHIAEGTTGRRIRLQAAMGNTCPDECMSNLVDAIIK